MTMSTFQEVVKIRGDVYRKPGSVLAIACVIVVLLLLGAWSSHGVGEMALTSHAVVSSSFSRV